MPGPEGQAPRSAGCEQAKGLERSKLRTRGGVCAVFRRAVQAMLVERDGRPHGGAGNRGGK
jgi:hypothetical protein